MATKNIIDVVIKLRRDTEENFDLVKNTFIPEKGEPILVDTTGGILRFKIGDGVSTYDELGYIDSQVFKGYYDSDTQKFYRDYEKTLEYPSLDSRLYLDLSNDKVYVYTGSKFVTSSGVTLYDSVGQNTDGAMTQKAVTDELDKKVEVDVNEEEDTLIFKKSSNLSD